MTQAKNYFAWQARLVRREIGRRVIEVGCGLGNFTGALLDRELLIAVDEEPACIAEIRARYPAVQARVCGVDDPAFLELQAERPDTCVCLNVLEHVEDHAQALRAMAEVLIPGGAVILFVPAFPALYGPIDRNLNHYRRYTRAALGNLASSAGLAVQKMHYVNAIGFFGWWFNAHVLKREAQSEGQIAVFDRMIVPVLARAELLVRPPFGQSLFAVLRKPSG